MGGRQGAGGRQAGAAGQGQGQQRVAVVHQQLQRTGQADGGLARGHWGIENSLHWVLDVVFREDDNRTRGKGGANLGMLRRVAVSLLKRAPGKGSIHTKRLQAGWDNDFLLEVLGGIAED